MEAKFIMKFHTVDAVKQTNKPATRADHAAFLFLPSTQYRIMGETMYSWISMAIYQECGMHWNEHGLKKAR